MFRVYFSIILYCFFICNSTAQEFGKVTPEELEMTVYDKDSTAHAVVLYERGETHFEVIKNYIQTVHTYYVKIKVFEKDKFEKADVSIRLFIGGDRNEKVYKIRGMTHNGIVKTGLKQKDIFENKVSAKWNETIFTLPNIQDGSVIEYEYKISSPFWYNLNGWSFQDDIPKIHSEFHASIPANYRYNRVLVGNLSLDISKASIKASCFHVPGYPKSADCEVIHYGMQHIPAFKEEEEYMLAKENYISRLEFELSEVFRLDGTRNKITKSWDDVDKEYKTDKDIGKQLRKIAYFEDYIKTKGLDKGTSSAKAKAIYKEVRDRFSWNEKFGNLWSKVRVIDAFEAKKGNVIAINIALINMLNAAGIDTKPVMLSTRDNGLPKKVHPVIQDFNYLIALADIDGELVLLDATDKLIPFGMLPYRALNHYGRVMDFKEGSYWLDFSAFEQNSISTRAMATLDAEAAILHIKIRELCKGYNAVIRNSEIKNSKSEEEYLEEKEESLGNFALINDYKANEDNDENQTLESFDIELELDGDANANKIYLNPFIIKFFSKNPFTLEKRDYPVDFGYPRDYKFGLTLEIPEGYKVTNIPEKKVIKLPDNVSFFSFECTKNSDEIVSVSFGLKLANSHYSKEAYPYLKDFFAEVTNIQNNTRLVLEKK